MNLDALNNIKLPSWLIAGIAELMETAEVLFNAPKSGAKKKAWVKQAAMNLLDMVDIPVLPNIIEEPLKAVLIDVTIDVLWAVLFDAQVVEEPVAFELPAPVRVPVRRRRRRLTTVMARG